MKKLIALIQLPFVGTAVGLLVLCGIVPPDELVRVLAELMSESGQRWIAALKKPAEEVKQLPPRLDRDIIGKVLDPDDGRRRVIVREGDFAPVPAPTGTQILTARAKADAKELGLTGAAAAEHVEETRKAYKDAVPKSTTEMFNEFDGERARKAVEAEWIESLRFLIPLDGRRPEKFDPKRVLHTEWLKMAEKGDPKRKDWERDALTFLRFRMQDTDVIRELGPLDPRIIERLKREGITLEPAPAPKVDQKLVDTAIVHRDKVEGKPKPPIQIEATHAPVPVMSNLPRVDVNAKTVAKANPKAASVTEAEVLRLRAELEAEEAALQLHVDPTPTVAKGIDMEAAAKAEIAAIRKVASTARPDPTRKLVLSGVEDTARGWSNRIAHTLFAAVMGHEESEVFLLTVPTIPHRGAVRAHLPLEVFVHPPFLTDIENALLVAGIKDQYGCWDQEPILGRNDTNPYWIRCHYGTGYDNWTPREVLDSLGHGERPMYVAEVVCMILEYPWVVQKDPAWGIYCLGNQAQPLIFSYEDGSVVVRACGSGDRSQKVGTATCVADADADTDTFMSAASTSIN